MPLPRWVARVNRRVFNPREIRKGVRPVLSHVGRRSGASYRTPLDAHPVDGGYIFVLMYGSGSDWVQNVLTAGSARLTAGGEIHELTAPRVIPSDDAWQQLSDTAKPPPSFANVTEYLQMDTAG